jgi:hypothetical protein
MNQKKENWDWKLIEYFQAKNGKAYRLEYSQQLKIGVAIGPFEGQCGFAEEICRVPAESKEDARIKLEEKINSEL